MVKAGSWAERVLAELVDDETPEYREVRAVAREALRLAVEEAARRCRELHADGLGGADLCAEAIEDMLEEKV